VSSKNYIGIYVKPSGAAVVVLPSGAKDQKPSACFTVESHEQANMLDSPAVAAELANLIADECAKRSLSLQNCEAAVALDCSMFMQHSMHSEFSDTSKIAQTIRFDAEEALATDISELAIAFKISSVHQAGSQVTVFTAAKKLLFELLGALQARNIDPISIEPDVCCLSRFVMRHCNKQPAESGNLVFAVLSESRGYLISGDSSSQKKEYFTRTFLIGPSQDKTSLLKREFALTRAVSDEPVGTIEIFDSSGTVNIQQLADLLSVKIENLDLAASEPGAVLPAECSDRTAFAIAAGAAEKFLDKAPAVDFRADFHPFEGKKLRLQKTVKFLSISLILLMVALGIYFQKAYLDANKPRKMMRARFEEGYLAVMPGTKEVPSPMKPAVKALEKELAELKNRLRGVTGTGLQKSVSDKLTILLEAINKCAEQTRLEIDSISITDRTIRVIGSTQNYNSTMQFREAIKQTGMSIPNEDLPLQTGNRHKFILNINVEG